MNIHPNNSTSIQKMFIYHTVFGYYNLHFRSHMVIIVIWILLDYLVLFVFYMFLICCGLFISIFIIHSLFFIFVYLFDFSFSFIIIINHYTSLARALTSLSRLSRLHHLWIVVAFNMDDVPEVVTIMRKYAKPSLTTTYSEDREMERLVEVNKV